MKETRPALRKGRAGRDGTRSRRAEAARAPPPVNTPAPGIVRPGDVRIWLDRKYVDRLKAMHGPGESYSDVILRLAAE